MTIKEKTAYTKGLIDGLNLDKDKKETKAIEAILDWMEATSETFVDLEEDVEGVCEQLSILDEDLAEVEHKVLGHGDETDGECDDDDCDCASCACDDCECDDCDCDDFYEVKCPTCSTTTCLDEDTLGKGDMKCPKCGEILEFCVGDEADCCACGDACDCDDDCKCGCHSSEER